MNDIEKYEKLEEYMRKNNLSIQGYCKAVGMKNAAFLNMSDEAYVKYAQCFDKLEKDIDTYHNTGQYMLNVQERGKLLEQMAGLLFFYGNALFDKTVNCKTATNEIDILVNWSKEALQIGMNQGYNFIGEGFLCECKNYTGTVNVTYIGKFYSLMKVSGVKFGIIFSRNGISGKNIWEDGKGLVRKIALKEDIYIIDISWDDFKSIYDRKKNIMNIMNNKYTAMKYDISYKEYISKHEQEKEFKSKIRNLKI